MTTDFPVLATEFSVSATVPGSGNITIGLTYNAGDLAYTIASALTQGLELNTATEPGATTPGSYQYLVVDQSQRTYDALPAGFGGSGNIVGAGYSDIVIGSAGGQALTVNGGGAAGGQTVIAGVVPGLHFISSDSTDTIFVAGGDANYVDLSGSTGTDQVYLDEGNNTVIAGGGATTIDGGVGANSIVGGSGANTIFVEGTDTVNLGTGAATVDVAPADGAPDNARALVYADTTPGGTSTLYFEGGVNVSTVVGGSGSETVFGNAGGGVFAGGSAGRNSLVGGTGSVTLTGGGSNDYLEGNAGSDSLSAGSGNNVSVVANVSGDTLLGGSGSAVFSVLGADTVNLGGGSATVQVGPACGTDLGSAFVNAGSGNLRFVGGSNASTVLGGGGSETVFGNAGGGYFSGGAGGNNVLFGGAGNATLVGGGSGDYLEAAGGADSLVAGAGNEILVAGSGADTLVGNLSGIDVFGFFNENAGVVYNISAFHTGDLVYMNSAATVDYALNHQTTAGGTTTITLADNTKIIVQGAASPLARSDMLAG